MNARSKDIALAGQSFWLDYITRDLVTGSELRNLIAREGIRGMTSNPTLFEKAIAAGEAYDAQIAELGPKVDSAGELFEALAVQDVRDACDTFAALYKESDGADGFVSIEVSPSFARQPERTLTEARRLWNAVDRPNVMIKVPGTLECQPAIRKLLREGINVNVTLLFSQTSHQRVMDAYIEALEERLADGEPIARVASVASFFLSRIDKEVDGQIERAIAPKTVREAELRPLLGRTAIANAKLAYQNFRYTFDGDRFAALRARGARVQRPLWASTSTKNPAYRDVVYVEALIGPDTVNTMPKETLQAMLEHGVVNRTIDVELDEARQLLEALQRVGIDLNAVTDRLEEKGIASFAKSYETLLKGVGEKREKARR